MKNVCLVGYGKIGPKHVHCLKEVQNAQLYAVCDIDSAKLRKCKEEYGVICYSSFDEMIKDKNIDSVHICTPHYLHFEMIDKAIKAGKMVVVEKPVTITTEEYDSLLNTEGIDKLCVVLQNRLNDSVVKLKEIIDSGEMGKIIAAKTFLTWHRSRDYYDEDEWRGKWKTEGGGVLINQAIHSLDLLVYLVGDITSVKANMMNYSLSDAIEVEDTFTGYLTFESGIHGMFLATNAYARSYT